MCCSLILKFTLSLNQERIRGQYPLLIKYKVKTNKWENAKTKTKSLQIIKTNSNMDWVWRRKVRLGLKLTTKSSASVARHTKSTGILRSFILDIVIFIVLKYCCRASIDNSSIYDGLTELLYWNKDIYLSIYLSIYLVSSKLSIPIFLNVKLQNRDLKVQRLKPHVDKCHILDMITFWRVSMIVWFLDLMSSDWLTTQ